jgi:hypothetical protein
VTTADKITPAAPSLPAETQAYDDWFRRQVQAAIDDPRACVDDACVRREFAEKRAALLQRLAKKSS